MSSCLLDADEVRPVEHVELMDHQKDVVRFLSNGKVLYGGVGAGKSITALAYYMQKERGKDIYVITTAKKRDSLDWEREAVRYGISTERDCSIAGRITIDSWNNIGRYRDVQDQFFIFDEQRLIGTGVWVKAFLKIAAKNNWILLTATPGDTWLDYAPIFIANGYYENITDFRRQHVIYAPYIKFPVVSRYIGVEKLERLRNRILIEMPYASNKERFINTMEVGYDRELWDRVVKTRWNVYENRPIRDVGELFRLMRKIVNSDPSRLEMVRELMKIHPKLIIFYNFNYELDILRGLANEIEVAEWNGHKKENIPISDRWVYLVQYSSGSESWNCIETNAMILFSLTYSYKRYVQSMGRIDRLDSPWEQLYIYLLVSDSVIDRAVKKALDEKRSFNERNLLENVQIVSGRRYK